MNKIILKSLILILVLLSMFNNLYSQQHFKKGKYSYVFKCSSMPSYYFYEETCSYKNRYASKQNIIIKFNIISCLEAIPLDNTQITLMIYGGDTINLITNENGEAEIETKKNTLEFKVNRMGAPTLTGYIDICDNKSDIVTVIVVMGEDFLHSGIIKSTKKLTGKELIMIGNDIIYGTNTSGFIEGKDYDYLIEI